MEKIKESKTEEIELSSSSSKLIRENFSSEIENHLEEHASNEVSSLRAYPRRWFILGIVGVAISLRGYNQSCYGPTNNIYSNYFEVEPWQIDWLVVVQSVIFLAISFPMTILTSKIGYRLSVLLITTTLTAGFIFTTLGVVWRSTFGIILFGQAIMGFSNIVSWSIPPATAAIWFPKDEVATAVALQVVGRGVGEAIGSFLPTILLKDDSKADQVKYPLLFMFSGLGAIACFLAVTSYFVVQNCPPTPPSDAQAKIIQKSRIREDKQDIISILKTFAKVVKCLFANKIFIAVWFVFGAVNPILRNNNVLLTSILHQRFQNSTNINMQSGVVLLVAWSLYTLGGFIAGPLITRTRAYKGIALFSIFSLAITCVVMMIGVKIKSLNSVYGAVMTQGLFIGMANTSLFELLAEVTYPIPPMFVTMIAIVILGLFRLTFPLVGRLLLKKVGSTWATGFPVIVTLFCTILILFIKPIYYREMANQNSEKKPLVSDDETIFP